MNLTVFTHFWNEEILLPFWLKHHLEIFDHGVLIDYQSTDGSADIVKELAPHWELHETVNPDFTPQPCDREVEAFERKHAGWKIALNTTEFLLCRDLRSFMRRFEDEFPALTALRTNGVIMVDSKEEQHQPLSPCLPLVTQRHHGYVESTHENPLIGGWVCARSRLLHKRRHGNYPTGRHTMHDYGNLDTINRVYGTGAGRKDAKGVHPELFLCWFGKFSPFEATKNRYLRVNARRRHKLSDVAWRRDSDLAKYERELTDQRKRSIDLLTIPAYRDAYESFC